MERQKGIYQKWKQKVKSELSKICLHFLLRRGSYILWIELPENLANTCTRKHWTAVSTALGLISSVYYDLHHWRSNQQPLIAEPKIYNRAIDSYRTQVTQNQLLMVIARPINLIVSCKLHPYSLQIKPLLFDQLIPHSGYKGPFEPLSLRPLLYYDENTYMIVLPDLMINTRIDVYRAVCMSTLLYDSEVWAIYRVNERSFELFYICLLK